MGVCVCDCTCVCVCAWRGEGGRCVDGCESVRAIFMLYSYFKLCSARPWYTSHHFTHSYKLCWGKLLDFVLTTTHYCKILVKLPSKSYSQRFLLPMSYLTVRKTGSKLPLFLNPTPVKKISYYEIKNNVRIIIEVGRRKALDFCIPIICVV